MLTPLTLMAVDVLNDIAHGGIPDRSSRHHMTSVELACVLAKLEVSGLIHRNLYMSRNTDGTYSPVTSEESCICDFASYSLGRPYAHISLLDILEATGEHLNCNQPTKEELYVTFRTAANKLGVINQMTRIYLSEIMLTDF